MIKKILFLFSSLLLLLPFSSAKALESGEYYSNFATNKVALVRIFNVYTEMYLYGGNNGGNSCSESSYNLGCWTNGELSLLTYAIPSNDSFDTWGMTFYLQTPLKKGVEYTLNVPFVTSREAVSNAMMRESNVAGVSGSQLISAETTCSVQSCNYIWKIKPTSDISTLTVNFQKVSTGIGLPWFATEISLFYYPRITTTSGDSNLGAVEYNQQVIISQNQTIINQNNQINNNLQDINDSINSDNVDDFSDTINSFEGFLDENSTITRLITLPVTLYSSILNNINSTCTPFNLGTLYGEPLILPCINIGNYLGSTLWGMIDLIISGFAIYAISKKFIKIFNNFSTLKEGDILDD